MCGKIISVAHLRTEFLTFCNLNTVTLPNQVKSLWCHVITSFIHIVNNTQRVYSQALSQLISSSRLSEQHTDVTPYTADGRVHLAKVSNELQRCYD